MRKNKSKALINVPTLFGCMSKRKSAQRRPISKLSSTVAKKLTAAQRLRAIKVIGEIAKQRGIKTAAEMEALMKELTPSIIEVLKKKGII